MKTICESNRDRYIYESWRRLFIATSFYHFMCWCGHFIRHGPTDINKKITSTSCIRSGSLYLSWLLTHLVTTKKSINNWVYSTHSFYTGLLDVRHSLSSIIINFVNMNQQHKFWLPKTICVIAWKVKRIKQVPLISSVFRNIVINKFTGKHVILFCILLWIQGYTLDLVLITLLLHELIKVAKNHQ